MLINKLIHFLFRGNSPYAGAFERNAEREAQALAAANQWLDAEVEAHEVLQRAATMPRAA